MTYLSELSCSSFAHAVATGGYAGVLPDIAAAQFDPANVTRFPLPFMKGYIRSLVLAWHPRSAAARDIFAPARECLVGLLR